MKPHISLITLGVEDLEKSVDFYRALGLETPGIVGEEFEYGAVAFFELQGGLKLALWPNKNMAHDTGLVHQIKGVSNITLGHNVNSKEEVDAVMLKAEAAMARIIKPATDTFWGGYAGYFQDPDNHVWEVVYNPAFVIPE